ncbi:hypothetical protein ACJZ2D_011266 [Fusarium nematophilum]
MKFLIPLSLLVAGTVAQDGCGFPDGPDCFADDGCCLLPFRCGNGDGGERCERVPVGANKRVRLLRVLRTRDEEPRKLLHVRNQEPKKLLPVRDEEPKKLLRARNQEPAKRTRRNFHGPRRH